MLASDVIEAARRLINDETSSAVSGVRWTDAELLDWIGEAQRETVKLKPEAYPVTATHDVDAADPRQRVSATAAYKVIRVERNADAANGTVTLVERDVLDTFNPNWTAAPTTPPTKYNHYVLDENDPLAFWLYPRATNAVDVIVTYAGIPAAPTATGNTLVLSDMYSGPVVDYVVYRALSKDARGGAPGVAEKYRDKFLLALGANRQIMRSIGQNANPPPNAGA